MAGFIEAGIGLKPLYTELFQRSLYDIGHLWERNALSVATEHLSTAITERLMAMTYPMLFQRDHVNKSIAVACVANEYHQVGAKMVCDLFELHGWNGFFFGANTPVDDLIKFLIQTPTDVLGLSLSMIFNLDQLAEAIKRIQDAMPHLPVLVGGQAFMQDVGDFFNRFKAVRYLSSLHEVENFVLKVGELGRV